MSLGQDPSFEELKAFREKHFLPTPGLYYRNPIQLVKAQGAYVWDEKDKKYLDALGGIICISAGHNRDAIKKGMAQMLDADAIQHTSIIYLSKYVMQAAEKLLDFAPDKLDRVAFTNSGSEANELAFMAARHATGETIVVNLRHGYHGGTSGTLAQCGHHNWRFRSQPVSNVTSAEAPYCYRCPFGKEPSSCGLECADHVESTIQTTTHGKIAAFIAEPIMGVGGFIDAPKEYFEKVVKIVHNYGGKYISDEVQTGAGRTGQEFLYTKELGIDADLVTMAKGFGNGAAVGAVLMKSDVAAPMAGKAYFNTFGGDPYQMMQAKVTMDLIEEEGLIGNAQKMGARLKDGLKELQKTHPLIGDVRGRGLLLGFELVKDRKTKAYAPEETSELLEVCKDKGLLIGKGGLFANVVRVAPPLNVNAQDIDQMLKIIDESLTQIENQYKGS